MHTTAHPLLKAESGVLPNISWMMRVVPARSDTKKGGSFFSSRLWFLDGFQGLLTDDTRAR